VRMVNQFSEVRMRLALHDLGSTLTSCDKTTLNATFRQTVSALEKNVRKGILRKKTASRCKSRLSARVKAVAATPDSAPPEPQSFIARLRALGYTRACPTCGACSTGEGCNPK